MPDTTKQFVLETDASKWATGAVLKQIGEDGKMHPCGFISHILTPPERNYQIYDRELLAVVQAIETWRYLLLGSPHPVIIHCDHKNLGFYKQTNRVTPQQAQWLSLLQPYDLLWEYIPGPKLIQADTLSRRPDHVDSDEDNDEEYYILIPPEQIIDSSQQTTQIRAIFNELADEIKQATKQDHFATLIKTNLAEGKTPIKSSLSDWIESDGVIPYQGKVYVPEDNNLRGSIIKLYHDTPHTGHPGHFKTIKLLKRNYWLKLPFQWKKHPVFDATLLTPYHETDEHGPNHIMPPPDLIEGEEQYGVETIIQHRRKGNRYEYLIKWKGYGSNENTLEPEANLSNSEEILEEYKKTHQVDEIQSKSKQKLLSPSSSNSTRRSTRSTRRL
jgi:hypothetical protein